MFYVLGYCSTCGRVFSCIIRLTFSMRCLLNKYNLFISSSHKSRSEICLHVRVKLICLCFRVEAHNPKILMLFLVNKKWMILPKVGFCFIFYTCSVVQYSSSLYNRFIMGGFIYQMCLLYITHLTLAFPA